MENCLDKYFSENVTPFAGVWIELLLGCQKYSHQISCGVADRCVSNIQGIE